MNELEKIEEAEYFYGRIVDCQENRDEFKYNLSAFLASSRSVLYYIITRSENNAEIQKWHDYRVSGNKILKFFKCKRNVNIHVKPINPNVQINANIYDTISITESVNIKLFNKNGNLKDHQMIKSPEPEKKEPEPPKISYEYKFSDWSGNEDVITLCRMYLDELKNIVKEGQSKGFLT